MKENIIGKEGAIFKINFLSLVDKTIESIIPIQYEFPLEKITTNLSEEKEYQQFIYNIFIPRLKEFINENITYYKIVAIQLKIKHDKLINNYDENNKNEDPEYLFKNKSAKIKLNEKSFQEVRDDILNMLLIDFINNSVEKHYYKFMDIEDNDNEEENEYKLLCLKNFINYKKINIHNKIYDYEYKISFKFKDFVKVIIDKNLYMQFKFWFQFLLQKIKINIVSLEYEYFMNYNEIKKVSDNNLVIKQNISYNLMIKNQVLDFLNEYINFIDDLLNDKSPSSLFKGIPKNKRPKVTLILINNMNWINYLLIDIEKKFYNIKEVIINYIKEAKSNKTLEIKADKSEELEKNKNLYYNNIYIKLFGKYSIYQLNSVLEKQNVNSIENIIINIDNFNHFEYISLIQEKKEEIINNICKLAINLLSSLNKFIIKIKKDKLKSIILYIKYFNNNNILLKEIQEKFNEFMIELIKQSAYVKYIDIFFSNIINEDDYNIDSLIKPDLIYSFPHLDEYRYKNIDYSKINQKEFKLVLFDNNIRIKKSQTIDFYFFEYFSLQRITNLNIGYFYNISELNLYLEKIKLYELCNMKKFVCFLKSNNKINEKSLTKFFKLQWPKNTLESIKLIFEKFVKIKSDNIYIYPKFNKNIIFTDMNNIYSSIIKEFYYKTVSKDEIEKIILDKYQGDLGGTMIFDKKNNDSFEKKINIIKKKKLNKSENEENTTNINNTTLITNNTKIKNTTNISFMHQSKNILLQTSQPTINYILDNNKRNNYMNELKSVNDMQNSNNYLFNNTKSNYPLRTFLIINSETYLKYFNHTNIKDFLKNSILYNNMMEKYINQNNNKFEDKYNLIQNCKKSLLVLNKNKTSILSLLYALNKTDNIIFTKLLRSKLKFKIINYEYFKRTPAIFDYILTFLNSPILIFNDFKYSKKLFKNVSEA